MDFQYNDGRGPVSADSPFVQAGAGNTQFKDSFAGQKREPITARGDDAPKE